MADYTYSKEAHGLPDPENAVDTAWNQYEPLITARQLRRRFLLGVDLRLPVVKDQVTDEDIHEFIKDAVAEIETETGLTLFPTQVEERHAFDRNEYGMMGYLRLRRRPVASIEAFTVTTSNEQHIWTINNDWIDVGYISKGLLYIVPINIATAPSAQGGGGAVGGAAFLAILGQQPWVPAYWRVKYTCGFKDGKFPRNVNLLIGCVAAINILNEVAQANAKGGSKSISLDGMSQSSSNPGPDIYKTKIDELTKRRIMLVSRLRTNYGTKIFSGNV